MVRIIIIVAVMLIGGIVSLFTVSGKDVAKYNDAMVAMAGTVDGSFAELIPFMNEYAEGKAIDLPRFTAAAEHAGQTIAAQSAVLEATKVPDDQLCRDFHASLTSYITNSKSIQRLYGGEVLTYVSAHNPPAPGDNEAVEKLFEDLIAKDTSLLQAVKASQQAMATKYKMKLQ